MFGPLALAVHMVGRIQIRFADLHDPACPPLREVELSCWQHPTGWAVHARPIDPPVYRPYTPSSELQADLMDLFSVSTEPTR